MVSCMTPMRNGGVTAAYSHAVATIRRYRPEDLEQCRSLWTDLTDWHRRLYTDESIGGADPGSAFDTHLAELGPERIFVAELDGRVVRLAGMVVLRHKVELEPLSVRAGCRGLGVATRGRIGARGPRAEGARQVVVRPTGRNTDAIRSSTRSASTSSRGSSSSYDLAATSAGVTGEDSPAGVPRMKTRRQSPATPGDRADLQRGDRGPDRDVRHRAAHGRRHSRLARGGPPARGRGGGRGSRGLGRLHPYSHASRLRGGRRLFRLCRARPARPRSGRVALAALIEECEARGHWKLLSRIFPQNEASLALARSLGFREVGVYRRHGQLDGEWLDCVIVEILLGPAAR